MPGLPSALFNIMEGGDLLVSFVCNKVLNISSDNAINYILC